MNPDGNITATSDAALLPVKTSQAAKPLTPKQQRFYELLCEGRSQSEAYSAAYDVAPDTKSTTISRKASELAHDPRIVSMLADFRQKQEDEKVLSFRESLEIVTKIARDETCKPSDRLAAVALSNTMQGHEAAKKVTVTKRYEGVRRGIAELVEVFEDMKNEMPLFYANAEIAEAELVDADEGANG